MHAQAKEKIRQALMSDRIERMLLRLIVSSGRVTASEVSTAFKSTMADSCPAYSEPGRCAAARYREDLLHVIRQGDGLRPGMFGVECADGPDQEQPGAAEGT